MDSDVVLRSVGDVDDEGIAVANLDGRTGELTVHGDDVVGLAQPLQWRRLYLFMDVSDPRNFN